GAGGAVGVRGPAEVVVAELADHRVRGERRLGRADDDGVGAAPDGPSRMRQRVQTAGLVAGHHAAGALEAAADGDLARTGRIEPGDRLVGPDVFGALAPQVLEFPLAELAA